MTTSKTKIKGQAIHSIIEALDNPRRGCGIMFLIFFFIFFSVFLNASSDTSSDFLPLRINIISYRNGVGLNKDIDILMKEINNLGHHAHFVSVQDHSQKPNADINVFVDVMDDFFFPLATKNYLIPNPEWCTFPRETVARFDKILCKTKEAERIFKPINRNSEYISFTCQDCYNSTIPKNFKSPMHLAGASIQKGTDEVVRLWINNPLFPTLFLIRHKGKSGYPPAENLKLIYEYLSEKDLNGYQNKCGLHICPSETEGFGHYLVEALSCENVIVTTDAPPMNELVTDKRCLVPYKQTASWNYATKYLVDPIKFDAIVSNLLFLSEDELKEIGRKNREFYLQNDQFFKKKIAQVFGSSSLKEPKDDLTEQVFTKIHQNKQWGEQHPCGSGSAPENTKLYRLFLQNFLIEQKIKSVVDIGCGDWQSLKLLDWDNIQYIGYDVIKEIVDKNNGDLSTHLIKFIHGNPLHVNLPKADLLLCKDVLQHWPSEHILLLLDQIDQYKHCIFINDVDPVTLSSNNENISLGGYRYLDPTKSPFNLTGKKVLTYISGDVTKQILHVQSPAWKNTEESQ